MSAESITTHQTLGSAPSSNGSSEAPRPDMPPRQPARGPDGMPVERGAPVRQPMFRR